MAGQHSKTTESYTQMSNYKCQNPRPLQTLDCLCVFNPTCSWSVRVRPLFVHTASVCDLMGETLPTPQQEPRQAVTHT